MTWNYGYTPHLWPSVVTTVCLLALSLYSWHRRSLPGAISLTAGCLFGAAWAFGSVMEYAAVDVAAKIEWVKIQGVFQLPIPTAVTCFFLEYAWPGRWLSRRNLILFSIPCLLAFGSVLTNDLYHLSWRGFTYDGIVISLLGPYTWIAMVYAFLGLGLLNLVIFAWLFQRSPQHRWPVVLMLAGQIAGRTLYALDASRVFISPLHYNVLGMAFEFLVYAIVLFRFQILDPIPMAQRAAIEQLHAGMLVTDLKGKVVSLNPAAERILVTTTKAARGKPIEELLPACPRILPDRPAVTEIDINLGTGQMVHNYLLATSRLSDWRGLEAGRLLMLHDVTEQKRAQAQILDQQRALAALHERERLSRELHDDLAQDLALINLQAQMICGLLDAGQADQARERLKILAQAARDSQLEVRREIYSLGQGMAPAEGFLPALQRFTETFQQTNGIPTELILPGDGDRVSISPTVEVQLLRIVQEAYANIRKHSRAGHVKITLAKELESVHLTIEDDGVGFDLDSLPAPRQNFGLEIMSERAGEVGGHVDVNSAPGKGTQVTVIVPVLDRSVNGAAQLTALSPTEGR